MQTILTVAGVKVRRIDEDGKSEPVYANKVSLKAVYDPMVSFCKYNFPINPINMSVCWLIVLPVSRAGSFTSMLLSES